MKTRSMRSPQTEMPSKNAKERSEMAKTHCPNCDAAITMAKPREGAIITCPKCAVELEIIRTDPFVVDFTIDWQMEDWEEEEVLM